MTSLPPRTPNLALPVRPAVAPRSADAASVEATAVHRALAPRPRLAYAATLTGPLPPPPASAATPRPMAPRHHSDSAVPRVAPGDSAPSDPLAGWQIFALFAYSEDIAADGRAAALARQLLALTEAANGQGFKEFHLTQGDALVDATAHGPRQAAARNPPQHHELAADLHRQSPHIQALPPTERRALYRCVVLPADAASEYRSGGTRLIASRGASGQLTSLRLAASERYKAPLVGRALDAVAAFYANLCVAADLHVPIDSAPEQEALAAAVRLRLLAHFGTPAEPPRGALDQWVAAS
jgi:hypothetical protein